MKVRKGINGRRGFSLIELVIVVVIIGIIGAIAIPRMSRGAAGAADSSLKANLAVLRNAIDLYAAEHNNTYPTLDSLNNGSLVTGDAGGNPLLDYTNAAGACSATQTGDFIYGPYLRSIPKLPVGDVSDSASLFGEVAGGPEHWVYNETTGRLVANSLKEDVSGKAYNTY